MDYTNLLINFIKIHIFILIKLCLLTDVTTISLSHLSRSNNFVVGYVLGVKFEELKAIFNTVFIFKSPHYAKKQ